MTELSPIKASPEARYLSEIMDKIFINCLLDKGKTGCGGTDLALTNDIDTIIVMPYVSLIKNKQAQALIEAQTKDLKKKPIKPFMAVYGFNPEDNSDLKPATNEEIIEYYKNTKKGDRKFCVTMDSYRRLVELLTSVGIDVFNEFFSLIDEWHVCFNSYIFRNRAVADVLKLSRQFNEVTYMTATPVEEEFILEEIKDLPIQKIEWENTTSVNLISVPTNYPVKAACDYIYDVLNDLSYGNLHFFVNSVEFIKQCIDKSGLLPEQVKIVCSKNKNPGKGNKTNQTKLGEAYRIQEAIDPPKLVNFYTGGNFEGCDVYDENGRIFIVSDKNKSHTLLDISTLVIQICGRIRDTKYCDTVWHIFTETRYDGSLTLEQFKQITNKTMEETESFVDEINALTDTSRKKVIELYKRDKSYSNDVRYVCVNDDKLKLDKNLLKLDIMNFKIKNHVYNSRIQLVREYEHNGFTHSDQVPMIYPSDKLKKNNKAKVSFKDVFEEYVKLKEQNSLTFVVGNLEDRKRTIEQEKPLIKQAYDILGVDMVRELKYNVTNIRRHLINCWDITNEAKIVALLKKELKILKPYPTEVIRERLQQIYDVLGVNVSAKASHLQKWCKVKKTTPKIKGKSVDHYEIIRFNII